MQNQTAIRVDVTDFLIIREVVRNLFGSQSNTADRDHAITKTNSPAAVNRITQAEINLPQEGYVCLGGTSVEILSRPRSHVGHSIACQPVDLLGLRN